MQNFTEFSDWLDEQLQNGIQPKGAALCFNLYENIESYTFKLIASEYFDENDSDWPCHEVYTSGENVFSISRDIDIQEWQDGLKYASDFVYHYLTEGEYREDMKSYEAVAIGFVDGDVLILCQNHEVISDAVSNYLKLYA